MLTPSSRSLLQALALSVALHGLLLIDTSAPLPLRLFVPARTIKAEIVRRPEAAAAPALVATPPPTPRPAPAGRAKAPPVAVVRPAAGAAASSVGAARETSATASAPAASAASASVSGAVLADAPDGLSADDLRHYRLSLAIAARRFKRYPALASERGWEGTAEVVIQVSTRLPAPQVLLTRSSGRRVLDAQAVDMLTQAARVTTLPESLRGRDFHVVLPVEFSLDDER